MKKRILIVHRDEQALRELRELFAREGYPVMTATDWETARRIADRFPAELMLTEMQGDPVNIAGLTTKRLPRD